jgi:hypothetical protein
LPWNAFLLIAKILHSEGLELNFKWIDAPRRTRTTARIQEQLPRSRSFLMREYKLSALVQSRSTGFAYMDVGEVREQELKLRLLCKHSLHSKMPKNFGSVA